MNSSHAPRPVSAHRSAYCAFRPIATRYEIGLFAQGSEKAAAQGHFVHVYVDRASRRPIALPPVLAAVVRKLQR